MVQKRGQKPLSQEQALAKVISVHGDKYDFSKFIYTRAHDKVEVICSKHGVFNIRYSDLSCGSGCIKCRNDAKIAKLIVPFEEFLNNARKLHGDKYEYLKETYTGSNQDVGRLS